MLSCIIVLVGGVLIPREYLWLYSTHITVSCLYLIFTKKLFTLFLTFVSLVFVMKSEIPRSNEPQFFHVGQVVWLKETEKGIDLFIKEPIPTAYHPNISLQVSSAIEYDNTGMFHVSQFRKAPHFIERGCLKGRITQIYHPDKYGNWRERQLYISHQNALIKVQLSAGEEMIAVSDSATVRSRVLTSLNEKLGYLNSWKFSKALLFGDNSEWHPRDTWVIRELGLSHLFVVSGLHSGFVFFIGLLLSRCVWQIVPSRPLLAGFSRRHLDLFLILPLLVGYAYLTNWGEPVIRASIMLGLFLLHRALSTKTSTHQVLLTALWFILLFDPRLILKPSLWLSFSIVYLLIHFVCDQGKLWKMLILQLMLSTASMVLVLGWQESISIASIPVNLILIPLSGMVWFPSAALGCLEVLIFHTSYIYSVLNTFLVQITSTLEYVVFNAPTLGFEPFFSPFPKILLLFLLCFWVVQTPLKRGWVCVVVIWTVLFVPSDIFLTNPYVQLQNTKETLVVRKKAQKIASDRWHYDAGVFNVMALVSIHAPVGVLVSEGGALTPENLLSAHIDWVFLKHEANTRVSILLKALQIKWLVIQEGQSLYFEMSDDHVRLYHTGCAFSFFLFKSDTCGRVAELESVLN